MTEIQKLELADGFWSDQRKSKTLLKEKRFLEDTLEALKRVESGCEDVQVLLEFAEADPSSTNLVDAGQEIAALEPRVRALELKAMLGERNDNSDAIVNINAGAGGTEAQDWAEMLLRMYLRYCEAKGFKVRILDQQSGEEAGIKSATFTAEGDYAFGFLKAEVGVHRLVRISPFDSNSRRHTSFASVFVYPDIEDEIEIEILDKDIRIDTYRAGGAGGQHVNKTDSAVRITHLPTNIVVQCQNERSQLQNRASAMKILKARLYEFEVAKRLEAKEEIENSKKDIAWGSQIRSYVLHPYRLVKDHRSNLEVGDPDSVLNGNIQGFIEAYLMSERGT
ncbi:MAG: peptide chain release factor 2 [Bdellovibrionales bacterium]|nr:peptide chain release factor 2 [Bdellovibrionales bacterium]